MIFFSCFPEQCSSTQRQDSALMQIKEERLEDDLWSQELGGHILYIHRGHTDSD